jgi:hypothetical protein
MRRTRPASERTYLARWRSALAAFAVSLGVGKIVPSLTHGPTIGYGRADRGSRGNARHDGGRNAPRGGETRDRLARLEDTIKRLQHG